MLRSFIWTVPAATLKQRSRLTSRAMEQRVQYPVVIMQRRSLWTIRTLWQVCCMHHLLAHREHFAGVL